ncbi:molybdate ABC transporter substrate-binding protein [Larkinella terrae]|uniref:Molybdate ABC transporter substrate-binding protein n=1 Tax=Larkinella terrae TaxID=2025311 RepID=A0A7K0EWA4_9BACT|nr:molybdate ABC transporter substrate-binding protein [Larkinella terrae]MRS65741.1 molybdate ABC transporter substrate-binding protein [Larkinella terrae]
MRQCLTLLLIALTLSASGQKIRVAVAANAQFVMEKLQAGFEKKTGREVETIVSSSGKLTTQIQNGAPFDVFLSADMSYPEAVFQAGLSETKPKIYAYGLLVLWTRSGLDPSRGLSVLNDKAVVKIAVANPKTAPYGTVAVDVLTKQKLLTGLQPKIVYGESIAQVNQYLISGAVDAGFTAKSVVLEPMLKDKGRWADVKGAEPIAQGVVLLKNAKEGSRAFYDYLFTPEARAIFRQYGYQLPSRQ